MRNLNLLFNKTYYEEVDKPAAVFDKHVERCNAQLFSAKFQETDIYSLPQQLAPHRIVLQVAYPGLLTGIGYAHSAGIGEKEIVTGFSFDYVTGQPYIPGSSVKGVLRSFFKNDPKFVMELLGKHVPNVEKLEEELFEGENVFFDAVVCRANAKGLLVGPESITPHPDPMQDPIPISLVKVLPGVCFEFRFRLKSTTYFTEQETLEIFQKLLTMFGIGARTNVGFGYLQLCAE